MAKTGRIRRRARRKALPVRRMPDARTTRTRDQASGLIVGGAHDPAERTADRMAAQALSGGPVNAAASPAAVRRMCKECEDEKGKEKGKAQRTATPGAALAAGASAAPAPASAAKAVAGMGPGRSLTTGERTAYEAPFRTDFSTVRLHEGPAADRATDALQARAFAHGPDIAFARGERSPFSMAHELAHVAQGRTGPVRRLDKCTSKTDPNQIVTQKETRTSISEPGDEAQVEITFTCLPRSFRSEWVDARGTVIRSNVVTGNAIDSPHTIRWDGKRQFKGVGTFSADDGTYRHRVSKLAYAPGPKTDLMVAAGGVASTSGPVYVQTRSGVMQGHTPNAAEQAATAGQYGPHLTFLSNHLFDATRTERTANVTDMANAMESEAGVGSATERDAIAWAIRNEMVRVNTETVAGAKAAFNFVDNKTGAAALQTRARDILGKPMSDDTAGGAIKWYSPKSMPPHVGDCKPKGRADCSGGDVTTTDGTNVTSKAPGFHKSMTFVDIAGVRQNFFRFYKL